MKSSGRFAEFKDTELHSPTAVDEVLNALFADLVNGDITVAEHRAIQEDMNARLSRVHSAMKTMAALRNHERRVNDYQQVIAALARWRQRKIRA